MLQLDKIKMFLRLDTNAEDMLLEHYSTVAEEYVKAACGQNVILEDPRIELVQLMLISDWFENRTMYGKSGYSSNINSILMQVRLETEGL